MILLLLTLALMKMWFMIPSLIYSQSKAIKKLSHQRWLSWRIFPLWALVMPSFVLNYLSFLQDRKCGNVISIISFTQSCGNINTKGVGLEESHFEEQMVIEEGRPEHEVSSSWGPADKMHTTWSWGTGSWECSQTRGEDFDRRGLKCEDVHFIFGALGIECTCGWGTRCSVLNEGSISH